MKSKLDDVPIPTDVSLSEFVLQNVRKHAESGKVAMVASDTGKETTYLQLLERVTTLACSLQCHGLVKEDIVSIICANCPEFPVMALAVLLAGGIVHTLSPLYTDYEMSEQLLDVGPKYVFTMASITEKVEKAIKHCDKVKEVFVLGSPQGRHTTYHKLLREKHTHLQQVSTDPTRDVAVLIYSSGTSGSPKGVMLSHHNIIANICQHSVAELMGSDGRQEVYLCVPPFVHCFGLTIVLLFGLTHGHKLITVTKFHFEEYLEAIQRYKASVLHVVPPLVIRLLKSPLVSKYDLSSVHTLLSGAAPLSAKITRQLKMTALVVRQDFVKSGCEKSWAEVQADSFSFECRGCARMKELEVELEELRLLVVAMVGREQGSCASSSGEGTVDDKVGKDTRDARESSPQPGRKLRGGKVTGHRETGRKETGRKGTGGKTPGVKERGVGETGGKEKGVGETGGKTTGVKERGVAETGGKEKGVGGDGREDNRSEGEGSSGDRREGEGSGGDGRENNRSEGEGSRGDRREGEGSGGDGREGVRTECDGGDRKEELFCSSDRGGEEESEGVCGGFDS
ncbi:putative 4-coumarate--CoA ligase 1 [Lamellibrachia satsuma]|nr:putative 4-coumarate--CoA ligase 1 [Lamellibrachia satsuma]